MSVTQDIETAISGWIETGLPNVEIQTGQRTLAVLEGADRVGHVRAVSASIDRLERGALEITYTFRMTILWSKTIDRDDRFTEWEAILAAARADQYLDGVSGAGIVEDAYVSAWEVAEVEGGHDTISADVTVVRYE